MKNCYLVSTGSALPGQPVKSDEIQQYLGVLDDENAVKDLVLRMNGIQTRHYAQTTEQQPTQSVYSMAARAITNGVAPSKHPFTFLAAGSTYAPYAGPGIGSIIHDHIARTMFSRDIEICSHAGICTSAIAGFAAAVRAIRSGDHRCAVSVGTEHASEILKSTVICPIEDRSEHRDDLRRSRWFMSVFLRFMLSDGAGAFVLQDEPSPDCLSLKVDWVHSRSYAHQTELCMKLENRTQRLTQDLSVLSRHLIPSTEIFLRGALEANRESIDDYRVVLPHLSSFYFRRRMEKVMRSLTSSGDAHVEYWTNLARVGNTGAASIFIMLDEFLRTQSFDVGDRMLLFVPESGQFNFALISLTAV